MTHRKYNTPGGRKPVIPLPCFECYKRQGKKAMTQKEAKQEFIESVGPLWIRECRASDKPALQEAWNNFTDRLCKDGRITQRQYDTWLNPFLRGEK